MSFFGALTRHAASSRARHSVTRIGARSCGPLAGALDLGWFAWTARLVSLHVLLRGHAANQPGDHLQREVFELLEPHAGLSHVQLLPGPGPGLPEPLLFQW